MGKQTLTRRVHSVKCRSAPGLEPRWQQRQQKHLASSLTLVRVRQLVLRAHEIKRAENSCCQASGYVFVPNNSRCGPISILWATTGTYGHGLGVVTAREVTICKKTKPVAAPTVVTGEYFFFETKLCVTNLCYFVTLRCNSMHTQKDKNYLTNT